MTASTTAGPAWEAMRTAETRGVEDLLRAAGFERADAYRYNSAVIRLRVVDPRFEGMKMERRHDLIDPHLARLPEQTEADIMTVHALAPSELHPTPRTYRQYAANMEFDNPSPSTL